MNKLRFLTDKRVALGICGVTTAFKSGCLVEKLRQLGADVQVILTNEASKYVSPITFERISGNQVLKEGTEPEGSSQGPELPDIDLLIIAPASFSLMGKLASGLGRDFLSEFASAIDVPVILAPSINQKLYSSQASQSHVEKLKELGFIVVEPEPWITDDRTDGDLPLTFKPDKIIDSTRDIIQERKLLKDKKVLVTSGPTRDPFGSEKTDSEKTRASLGYKLSRQARAMGGEVMLVSGPTEQIPPSGVGVVWVRTVEELDDFLIREAKNFDLILLTGSAEDWNPNMSSGFIREEKTKKLDLDIPDAPDLARKVGRQKDRGQVLIEFFSGREKGQDIPIDRLVENDINGLFSALTGDQTSEGGNNLMGGKILFMSGDSLEFQLQNKSRLSRSILKEIGKKYFS